MMHSYIVDLIVKTGFVVQSGIEFHFSRRFEILYAFFEQYGNCSFFAAVS